MRVTIYNTLTRTLLFDDTQAESIPDSCERFAKAAGYKSFEHALTASKFQPDELLIEMSEP